MNIRKFEELQKVYKEQIKEVEKEVDEIKNKIKDRYSDIEEFFISGISSDELIRDATEFFGKKEISVVSIDGSAYSVSSNLCLSFWIGATVLLSRVDFRNKRYTLQTKVRDDLGFVGVIPVAYSSFEDETYGRADNFLMTLAEIYTAHKVIESEKDIDLILLDGSLLFSLNKHTNFFWGRQPDRNPFKNFESFKDQREKLFDESMFSKIEREIEIWRNRCEELFEGNKKNKDFIFSEQKLSYYIGVGLLGLWHKFLRACKENKKLIIVGISKRSSSRSFFRNFITAVKGALSSNNSGLYDVFYGQPDTINLYWLSDMVNFKPPTYTVEYDGVFEKYGGKGSIETYVPPGVILRSYCQIDKHSVGKNYEVGYILAIDRFAFPDEKNEMWKFEVNQEAQSSEEKGSIKLYYYPSHNKIQNALVGILKLLSPAKTPLTVGYPEPLILVDRQMLAIRNFYSKIPQLQYLYDLDVKNVADEKLSKLY